jgi:nitrite reductase/ring-hydroxylating ferredoxin subunit
VARYVVASVEEIPPGGRKIVEVGGRSIGIFNVRGEFFALRNRCPHQGGPLCVGKTWGLVTGDLPGQFEFSRKGEILACPWHGWEFDMRTGQSWCDPQKLRVRAYQVSVEPGATLVADAPDPDAPEEGMVKGPFMAETYPVSIDGEYVVVDVGN